MSDESDPSPPPVLQYHSVERPLTFELRLPQDATVPYAMGFVVATLVSFLPYILFVSRVGAVEVFFISITLSVFGFVVTIFLTTMCIAIRCRLSRVPLVAAANRRCFCVGAGVGIVVIAIPEMVGTRLGIPIEMTDALLLALVCMLTGSGVAAVVLLRRWQ